MVRAIRFHPPAQCRAFFRTTRGGQRFHIWGRDGTENIYEGAQIRESWRVDLSCRPNRDGLGRRTKVTFTETFDHVPASVVLDNSSFRGFRTDENVTVRRIHRDT